MVKLQRFFVWGEFLLPLYTVLVEMMKPNLTSTHVFLNGLQQTPTNYLGGGFKHRYFTPTWGHDPICLIFFKRVVQPPPRKMFICLSQTFRL